MAFQSVFSCHLSLSKIGNYKSCHSNPRISYTNVSPSSLSQCKNSRIFRCQVQGTQFGDAKRCRKVPFFRLEKSPKRQNIFLCLANSDVDSAVEASNSGENAKESSTKNATQEIANSDVDSAVEISNSGKDVVESSTKNATQEIANSDVDSAVEISNSGKDVVESSTKNATQENVKEVVFTAEEPFRGKSGSISFSGLTHQVVEERKLVSSPFKDATGSLVWILGPLALLSSLLVPQFIIGNIDAVFGSEVLADIIFTFTNEFVFYIGCAAFLLITDHVQRPYLEFSAKRWGLITGLRGYLTSSFFIMGFKLFAPLLALYVLWPVLGLPAFLAVAPFIIGCGVQSMFEAHVERCESSCWPLVPIIFEVYRLYQLSRAAHFLQTMVLAMKGSEVTPQLVERANALVSLLAVIRVLGVVCLWSLITFLIRLFPSRPVSENY